MALGWLAVPIGALGGMYTFSVVLLLASPGQVEFEADERGFQILVGSATKRYPQPMLAAAVPV